MKIKDFLSHKSLPKWAILTQESLLITLRERDPYTYGHCLRVGRNTMLLAKEAGLSDEQQSIAFISGVFHDIGKIGIPDAILLKPGRLTDEEHKVMDEHPILSVQILQPLTEISFFKKTIPGVLHHHERIDGKGYPHQLKGQKIPLIARIILIADSFDAMTSTRSYRRGLTTDVASAEIEKYSGTQFDPDLAKIFLNKVDVFKHQEEELTEEFINNQYKKVA